MPEATGCTGTFVANNNVVSQSVAHLHVHVVPRVKGDGLRGFFWPRTTYADGELEAVGTRLREVFGRAGDPDIGVADGRLIPVIARVSPPCHCICNEI